MRVEHTRVDEFFADLELDITDEVIYQNTVRLRIDEIDEQDEGISQMIQLWITYVRAEQNDDRYVIGIGVHCGSTADRDHDAAAQALAIKSQLTELSNRTGFKLRPGKIEFA